MTKTIAGTNMELLINLKQKDALIILSSTQVLSADMLEAVVWLKKVAAIRLHSNH